LRAWQVRHRDFTVCRRGLDPAEVTTFLGRVADELAVAHTAMAALTEENQRIKQHLRAWQTWQSRHHAYDLAGR
jgi:DivIVA domain-containing protein